MVTNNSINLSSVGIPIYDGAGTFSATTTTVHDVLVGGVNNTIVNKALTDGALLIGVTGADPAVATLTPGVGISVTNAAGAITIASTGGGVAWSTISGTTQTAAVNSGYVIGNAGQTTVTLPGTAALGSVIIVAGSPTGTAGWKIAQPANVSIIVGKLTSTVGVVGYIQSTFPSDCVTLTCIVPNLTWECVTPPQGNITVA